MLRVCAPLRAPSPLLLLAVAALLCACAATPARSNAAGAGERRCPAVPPRLSFHWPLNGSLPLALSLALQRVDALFAAAQQNHSIPGLVASVVFDQKTLLQTGYGKKNAFDPNSSNADAHTLTRVASLSKLFTSLLMFTLRDAGHVAPNDPIQKFMPAFTVKSLRPVPTPLVLAHLASHTSGLPRESPCVWSDNCTEAFVLDWLSNTYLLSGVGEYGRYSNLGFSMLGRCLGKAIDASDPAAFERAAEALFQQMGMNASTFELTQQVRDNVGVGEFDGKPVQLHQYGFDNPACSTFTSAADMSTFMKLLFAPNSDTIRSPPPIAGTTLQEFLAHRTQFADGHSGYGSPWEYTYDSEQRHWIAGKAGALNGYRSQVSLVPSLKLGVFVSAFATSVADSNVWANEALAILAPALTQLMWADQQHEHVIDPNMYVGSYSGADGGVTVRFDGSALLFAYADSSQPLNLTFVAADEDLQRSLPRFAFVAHLVDSERNSCLSIADGSDGEIAFFTVDPKTNSSIGVEFMGVFAARSVLPEAERRPQRQRQPQRAEAAMDTEQQPLAAHAPRATLVASDEQRAPPQPSLPLAGQQAVEIR